MKIQSINPYKNFTNCNQIFKASEPRTKVHGNWTLEEMAKERDKNYTRAIVITLIIEILMVAAAYVKNKIDRDSELQQKIESIYNEKHSQQKTFLVE